MAQGNLGKKLSQTKRKQMWNEKGSERVSKILVMVSASNFPFFELLLDQVLGYIMI